VAGRSPDRPEKQDYPALSKTRNTSLGPQGSTHSFSLYLRCHLPGSGRRRGAGAAQMQHRSHEPASQGNLRRCCARSPRDPYRRPGRMALLQSSGKSGQYHATGIAIKIPGIEPGRKHLAVHEGRTGSQTGYSNPTTTLSIIAASPGTNLSISLGESCQSGYEIGPINDYFCRLVLEL